MRISTSWIISFISCKSLKFPYKLCGHQTELARFDDLRFHRAVLGLSIQILIPPIAISLRDSHTECSKFDLSFSDMSLHIGQTFCKTSHPSTQPL